MSYVNLGSEKTRRAEEAKIATSAREIEFIRTTRKKCERLLPLFNMPFELEKPLLFDPIRVTNNARYQITLRTASFLVSQFVQSRQIVHQEPKQ
jgi:hypothetical protein